MALKVEAKGGNGGTQWDDGFNYEGVTKIQVRGGREGLQFIKFDYVKAGKTIEGPVHGVSGRGLTQTFEINHLEKEYLLSVEGYYDESTGVIQSVQFKTNKKTSDMMGYTEGTKFSLGGIFRSRIIGFHGFADKNLNSLGAYFIRVPATKSAMQGGQNTGKAYDHGGDYDGIRKVYVTYDGTAIRHLKVDFDKAGQVESHEHGTKTGTQHELVVNYPYEYITSVEGSYAVTQGYGVIVLRSLTFNTSNGRSLVVGSVTGTKFLLESQGNAIVGFHGRVGSCVDSIGAYYTPFSPQLSVTSPHLGGLNGYGMVLKVEAKGGSGGNQWDDGFDYDGVTKIRVRGGREGLQFVKFDYVKAGKTIEGPIHGDFGRGLTQTFEINHLEKEYLLSVEGYYDKSTGVIQAVQFKTNKKTSDMMGYNEGTKFSIGPIIRSRIIGFHGFVDKNPISLGAYFIRVPATKSAMQGGQNTGKAYDHGGDYDGIRKVYVTYDGTAIRHLKVDFDKAGQVESHEHGTKTGTQHEFVVNYPYEYITSVEGSYAVTQGYGVIVLRSLTFNTSNGRSLVVGSVTGTKFLLESQGNAIVGFHGRVGSCVDSIGAYYAPFSPPSPSPPPAEKLEGQGGDGGDSWDDGAFQNVKKIYVGQGDVGIVSVKFEYENDASEVVVGEEHGKQTLLGYEEFELDYPSEYITSVEACHDKVMGAETGVITMLKFKTNKRTSPPFGLESASNFVLQKEGHKITGFHGKSGTVLHKIGVHVVPITE